MGEFIYHAESKREDLHHWCPRDTHDARGYLSHRRLRLGRWRPVGVGDVMFACECYAGGGFFRWTAHIYDRHHRVVGVLYKHPAEEDR